MKKSDLGTEARAYDGSGSDGTEDGISIVEQLIGKRPLTIPAEVRTKESAPILPSCCSLPIGTISTKHLPSKLLKPTCAGSVPTTYEVCLIIDF